MLDVDVEPQLGQPAHGSPARLVVTERREELAPAGEPGELSRDDSAPAGGFRPDLGRVDDLAGLGPARDPRELDAFDMPDDSGTHLTHRTIGAWSGTDLRLISHPGGDER
jgi:hypothetical protein